MGVLFFIFFSFLVWSEPHVVMVKSPQYLPTTPIADIACWDKDNQFDISLCQITKADFSCEKGVELSNVHGYKPPPPLGSNIDRDFDLNVKDHTIGQKYLMHEAGDFVIENFVKVNSITLLEDSSKDITKYFTPRGQFLYFGDHPEFISYLQPFLAKSTIIIKGICTKYKSKLPINIFPIYEKPDKKSKEIGKIVVYGIKVGNQPLNISIQGVAGGKIQHYPLKVSPFGFYKQIDKISGEFIDVGDGPWGKSGWSIIPHASMFTGAAIYFQGPDGSILEFYKDEKGDLFKRLISKNAISSAGDYAVGSISHAQQQEYLDKKGQLTLSVYDISIPQKREFEVPSLIDLTNGQFIIDGPSSERFVAIYNSGKIESTLLGHLHLSFKDNHLSINFVDNKNHIIKYVPDYFIGRCGTHPKFTALQNIVQKQNFFSNIGEGPWGKAGWVRQTRIPLSSEDLPIKFKYQEREIQHLGMNYSGMHLSLRFFSSDYRHSRNHDYRREPLELKVEFDFVEMDGKILLEPSCESKKVVEQIKYETRYVNLVSDKPAIRHNIYKSMNDESSLVGYLEYHGESKVYQRKLAFIPLRGSPVNVNPLFNKVCPDTKDYLLMPAISQQGAWVELGDGHWGKSAWIKGHSHPITDLPLMFWFPQLGFLSLDKIEEHSFFFTRDGNKQEVRAKQELYTNEGKILGSFSCRVKN